MRIRSSRTVTAAVLAAALVLLAAACGDDDDDGGGGAAGGATETTTGELGEATTAVEVRVPTTPKYVRGADGKVHLEFDLITTNVLFAPVTLTSLVVRDGEQELLRLDSDGLGPITLGINGAPRASRSNRRRQSSASSTSSCRPLRTRTSLRP